VCSRSQAKEKTKRLVLQVTSHHHLPDLQRIVDVSSSEQRFTGNQSYFIFKRCRHHESRTPTNHHDCVSRRREKTQSSRGKLQVSELKRKKRGKKILYMIFIARSKPSDMDAISSEKGKLIFFFWFSTALTWHRFSLFSFR